ncbi:hypothetical protein [Cerasicoccus frondis]|uniref:hypothetical protein n=1 Tax=Cerasicoccus frondis TaxID=490090 RepID=UPI0028525280|nr:hypothetical protein [Cerasicoccus frondis]
MINGADMHPSKNDYDWLGHGYYFWEDDPKRALQWAKESARSTKGKIKKAAVLGAVIRLGHCLNLADGACLAEVKIAHDVLARFSKEFGMSMPQNKGKDLERRYLDCYVFEWLHQFREDKDLAAYDTVRGFFSEGDALYPGSEIHLRDHIQICVRNLDCIVGFFRPRISF